MDKKEYYSKSNIYSKKLSSRRDYIIGKKFKGIISESKKVWRN